MMSNEPNAIMLNLYDRRYPLQNISGSSFYVFFRNESMKNRMLIAKDSDINSLCV